MEVSPCALFRSHHLALLHKLLERLGGNNCGVPLRGGVSARHASSSVGVHVWERRGVAVIECFQECDDLILLLVRQAEIAGRHVNVRRDLGRWPAGYLFDGSCRALSRLNGVRVYVARVVEVNELFQALDVSIVEELLLEIGSGCFRAACALGWCQGYIASGGHLHLPVDRGCILRPTRVGVGSRTETASEEAA